MLLIDLKIAIKALRATRARTALTMLGIIIGVASVTVVMALGEGAKEKIRSEVSQLGTDLITIRPGKVNRDTQGNIANVNLLAALSSSTLTEQDFDAVSKLPNVTAAAPLMPITGSITDASDKEAQNTTIIATTNQAPRALGIKIRNGEFLSDITNRETVVLGQELAVELLGADNAVGNKIKLRGQEFTVVLWAIYQRCTITIALRLFRWMQARLLTTGSPKFSKLTSGATNRAITSYSALRFSSKFWPTMGARKILACCCPKKLCRLPIACCVLSRSLQLPLPRFLLSLVVLGL
jgi:ABC-type antimicrobial peptide transport system permease subunit